MFYVQFFAIRRGEHGAGVVVNRAHDGVCRASEEGVELIGGGWRWQPLHFWTHLNVST
jgi:hypothetical protein